MVSRVELETSGCSWGSDPPETSHTWLAGKPPGLDPLYFSPGATGTLMKLLQKNDRCSTAMFEGGSRPDLEKSSNSKHENHGMIH